MKLEKINTIKENLAKAMIKESARAPHIAGRNITVNIESTSGKEVPFFTSKAVGLYRFLTSFQTLHEGQETNYLFFFEEYLVLENEMVVAPRYLRGGDEIACGQLDFLFATPFQSLSDVTKKHQCLLEMISLTSSNASDSFSYRPYVQVVEEAKGDSVAEGNLVDAPSSEDIVCDVLSGGEPVEVKALAHYEIISKENVYVELNNQIKKETLFRLKGTTLVALLSPIFRPYDVFLVDESELTLY